MSDKERRTMPKGVEWPMVDGRPVMPGDVLWDLDGNRLTVGHATVTADQSGTRCSTFVYGDSGEFIFHSTGALTRTEPPKPVLGKDGKAVEPGEVVWGEDGLSWLVTGFRWDSGDHVVEATARGEVKQLKPGWLTHEEPESWERLEEDAAKGACAYFGSDPCECGGCPHDMDPDCNAVMALDIVRRAKALAGVGADE